MKRCLRVLETISLDRFVSDVLRSSEEINSDTHNENKRLQIHQELHRTSRVLPYYTKTAMLAFLFCQNYVELSATFILFQCTMINFYLIVSAGN